MPNRSVEAPTPAELEQIYRLRFDADAPMRDRVWRVLTGAFFSRLVRPTDTVLDLGCGYGQFINHIASGPKYAMDLNAGAHGRLDASVQFLLQDCSTPWPVPAGSLDVVFTSNFLEHLPTKAHVEETLAHAHRALKPGGRLILLGPNIQILNGAYWDFWDHYVPISHVSLVEALKCRGFEIEIVRARFLPYTMVGCGRWRVPAALVPALLRTYLAVPLLWRIFGGQFLVVARRPNPDVD